MHLDAAHELDSQAYFPEVPVSPEKARASLIHELFEQQVRIRPSAVVLSMGVQSWTYLELDRAANCIAAAIADRLPPVEALVGIHIDRSFEMLAGLLGVLKSGAAYLPLDPRLPDARLRQIVDDAQPSLLLSGYEDISFAPPGLALLPIPVALQSVRPASRPRKRYQPDGESLAYVMYTSGSTGRPKGVEIRHGAVTNLLDSARVHPGFGPHDVLLAATRMSFDVSVLDFFLPLSCGARIVMVSQEEGSDPHRLKQIIGDVNPTVMQATPATWRGLLEAGWQGNHSLAIWVGGEALSLDLAERLLPLCRDLWNLYGPTETTVWSTMGRIAAGKNSVSIGIPIANTSVHILDGGGDPVPNGGTGELCIGGSGLARGYRFREDLTREKFVDLTRYGRVYRTGDLARRGPDGSLYCLGRIDDQVKIRGYRVEMGEVEAVLSKHPQISWCAVRCWPDTVGENALYAYSVACADDTATESALKAYLAERLPDYMVPHRIFPMEKLPLTSNGKIDRGALPDPRSFKRRPETPGTPLTSTELRLSAIWCELLELHDVLPQDDFFDLGGYSLLTMRLIRRIAQDFGKMLSTAQLFSASTLAQMGALLENYQEQGEYAALIPLQPYGDCPPLIWLDAGPLLRDVARAIGPEQPVLGLNLSPLQESRLSMAADFDVESVAAEIVQQLQEIRPQGPLYLGGWCRWGVVAFEVACALQAKGRDVRLLILLDSCNPAIARPSLLRRAVHGWRKLVTGKVHEPRKWASFSQRVAEVSRHYRPSSYDGRVALFEPAQAGPAILESGWGGVVTGPITIYRSPGNHESMVRRPHSGWLGAAMLDALKGAQAQ